MKANPETFMNQKRLATSSLEEVSRKKVHSERNSEENSEEILLETNEPFRSKGYIYKILENQFGELKKCVFDMKVIENKKGVVFKMNESKANDLFKEYSFAKDNCDFTLRRLEKNETFNYEEMPAAGNDNKKNFYKKRDDNNNGKYEKKNYNEDNEHFNNRTKKFEKFDRKFNDNNNRKKYDNFQKNHNFQNKGNFENNRYFKNNQNRRNNEENNCKHVLKIVNLPYKIQENDLREYFLSKNVKLERITMLKNKENQKFNGMCLANCSNEEDLEKGLNLNEDEIQGRKMKIFKGFSKERNRD